MTPTRGLLALVTLTLGLLAGAGRTGAQEPGAPEPGGPVYLIEVTGTIDLGLAPYLDRALDDAEEAGAAAAVVRIDTPGGRLDAVIQMRDALLDASVPTVAFVDSTAFSAGALVAIACDEIYLTPGAVLGAATPVEGGTGEVADEKTISAVRATFESTAEANGRDPQVAAAMVDTDVVIDGLVDAGELLTLTVPEALEWGYAEGVVDDLDGLLAELGLAGAERVQTSPSLAEDVVRFVTQPIIASLLLLAGLGFVIGDLASGGIGAGVVVGAGLLALFFWGHALAGLAGWEDIVLVALGLGLIAVEVFVIPGFGVAGVLGLLALAGGAFLSLIYRDFDFVTRDALVRAGATTAFVVIGIVVGMAVLVAVLARRGPPRGLVLDARLGDGVPVTERTSAGWLGWFGGTGGDRPPTEEPRRPAIERSLVGATGIALSDLRPSGIAEIEGERVDVVTTGDYVHRGEGIEVVRDEHYRRVVRRRRG